MSPATNPFLMILVVIYLQVMLLGHNDNFVQDVNMKVTVAFNHFGPGLVERMPRQVVFFLITNYFIYIINFNAYLDI